MPPKDRPEIEHHLTSKHHNEVSLGDEAIPASDFRIEDRTPPPPGVLSVKALKHSETRFIDIASTVLGYDPGFELDSEIRIVLDNRTLSVYHELIGKVVKEYSTFVDAVWRYRSSIGKGTDTRSQGTKVQQANHTPSRGSAE